MSHHHSDVLKPKEVVRILEHLGFEHIRNHGSHTSTSAIALVATPWFQFTLALT